MTRRDLFRLAFAAPMAAMLPKKQPIPSRRYYCLKPGTIIETSAGYPAPAYARRWLNEWKTEA